MILAHSLQDAQEVSIISRWSRGLCLRKTPDDNSTYFAKRWDGISSIPMVTKCYHKLHACRYLHTAFNMVRRYREVSHWRLGLSRSPCPLAPAHISWPFQAILAVSQWWLKAIPIIPVDIRIPIKRRLNGVETISVAAKIYHRIRACWHLHISLELTRRC
jgi:hypothetical protein